LSEISCAGGHSGTEGDPEAFAEVDKEEIDPIISIATRAAWS
jgi:hypothetical protein